MADILLKNISKKFNSNGQIKEVLNNINLEIKDKSFCVLLGASGCGKSTLLRLIAGLETPDTGEIYIQNRLANNIPPKDRDIAFVFQSYALYPHLSVFENIAFPLKIRKLKKEEIQKKVKHAASILGLEDVLKRKPKELSGGQRQRVALGRAIVREPEVFLMDEPLSNLDAKLRGEMRLELKKLHQKLQTTFIYVTHDQTEALTMGDEIVILNQGGIFQKGSPDEIFKTPENTFTAAFSGTYPMNLLTCSIKQEKINAPGFCFEIPDKYKTRLLDCSKVIAGIRPEYIKLSPDNKDDICLKLKIDFVENTGAIKILHLDNEIKAVVNCRNMPACDTKFYINPDDFVFFDYFTKKLIK